MARGNQHVLLTESAAFREDRFLLGAGDRAGMKETYGRRQERSVGSTHADLLSF